MYIVGLEELTSLRELDLANNCICDHRELKPVKTMTRLNKVCGNKTENLFQFSKKMVIFCHFQNSTCV